MEGRLKEEGEGGDVQKLALLLTSFTDQGHASMHSAGPSSNPLSGQRWITGEGIKIRAAAGSRDSAVVNMRFSLLL